MRIGYDFSDSDNAFILGGPRVQELTTGVALSGPSAIVYPGFTIPAPCTPAGSTCFQQLPAVTNTWQRMTLDVKHYFNAKVGIGVGYWFEKLSISDFATLDLPNQRGHPADRLSRSDPHGLRQPSLYGQHRVHSPAISLLMRRVRVMQQVG